MALVANYCGPSYRTRSKVIAADTCLNMYLEITEQTGDVKQGALYGTPGLRGLFSFLDQDTGCRGLFAQDGLFIAVVGGGVYNVNIALSAYSRLGTVDDDGHPVFMASNGDGGQQLMIVSAGSIYIVDLTTFALSAAIVLPFSNPICAGYIDGYFIALEQGTPKIWFSALEDGTSWSGLDFFARSETSDDLIGFVVVANRIWGIGSQTSEVFYNTGDTDTPFAPVPSTLMQEGGASPWAMGITGESVWWLAQDNQGGARVVWAESPQPQVISTPALSYIIGTYPTLSDAEGVAYEQDGHPFVCLTFPSAPQQDTWCFDGRTQVWHQRNYYSQQTGTLSRWRVRGLAVIGQHIYVGDYQGPVLYELDLDTYTDNGNPILRERTAPYLSSDNQIVFLDQFELGMEAGVGLSNGQGSQPTVLLEVSWDGANTFGPPVELSLGAIGQYEAKAIAFQLGSGRQDKLVMRTRMTDPVKTVIGPGAWIRATPGTGLR